MRCKGGGMAEMESVTLPVKIYERFYNVEYPNERKVQELMLEFATK